MKNFGKLALSTILMALIITSCLITSCQDENVSDSVVESVVEPKKAEGKIIPSQYIIVFKDSKIEPASKVLEKSSFSNYNINPIDVIATGSSIRSTYLNGGYATLNGTSMTSPHVAGIMHARGNGPRTSGTVSNRG